jgi:hypothetical protein
MQMWLWGGGLPHAWEWVAICVLNGLSNLW